MAKRILITGSGGPIGVNISRSLQKAKEKLVLIGTECNAYHTHLSITEKTLLIPPANKETAYVDSMQKLIDKEAIDMIFPTHPIEVRAIAKHKDKLSRVKTFLPPLEIIQTGQNKWASYQAFCKAEVPAPQTFLIETPKDLESCFKEISSKPIWVRGAGVPGQGIGVASLPCQELEHAKSWVDYWDGWGGMIASEYMSGANLTWCALYKEGKLLACQSRERLEYVLPHVSPSGITGAPAVSRTISRSDVF